MTDLDPAQDGTFDILDYLPEHIRPKYVYKLTMDQMAAVILAVWRERDAAKESAKEAAEKELTSKPHPKSTASVSSNSQTPVVHIEGTAGAINTSAKEPKHARSENQSLPAATSSDNTHTAAKKVGMDTVDLVGSFGLLQLGIHTHEEFFETTGAERDDSETLVVFKTEQDTEGQGAHSMPSTANEDHPKNLPFVLYVPEQCGSTSHKSIDDLPTGVGLELERRFNATIRAYKSRVEAYRKLLRNPAKYAERPFCVCDQIFKNLKLTSRGKVLTSQSFGKGGRVGVSADDKCIKENLPCLHLICNEVGDGHVLCIVPLPEQLRGTKEWTDLKFWVEE